METIIKEKQIFFTTEMVRAILNGAKTQTRRIINFKKLSDIKKGRLFYSPTFNSWVIEGGEAHLEIVKAPYEKGMRLWVRETFAIDDWIHSQNKGKIIYKTEKIDPDYPIKWKSSRYMPRAACRIELEIINVRVEQVQNITVSDMIQEGVTNSVREISLFGAKGDERRKIRITPFQFLWNSINEKRGYGWDVNPWVWVIEFKIYNAG